MEPVRQDQLPVNVNKQQEQLWCLTVYIHFFVNQFINCRFCTYRFWNSLYSLLHCKWETHNNRAFRSHIKRSTISTVTACKISVFNKNINKKGWGDTQKNFDSVGYMKTTHKTYDNIITGKHLSEAMTMSHVERNAVNSLLAYAVRAARCHGWAAGDHWKGGMEDEQSHPQ